MNLADLPVPGKAGLTAVVAALLKGTTEQLDHPGPLRGNVSFFPFLLQVTEASEHTETAAIRLWYLLEGDTMREHVLLLQGRP